jgi:hypothetical protein
MDLGKPTVIRYEDREERVSTRRILPLLVFTRFKNDRTYVIAWCYQANALRLFRQDRILASSVQVSGSISARYPPIDPVKLLAEALVLRAELSGSNYCAAYNAARQQICPGHDFKEHRNTSTDEVYLLECKLCFHREKPDA